MPRYRRIIADQFIDGPRPVTDTLPCVQAPGAPGGDRPNIFGVLPGMALIRGVDRLPGEAREFAIYADGTSNRVNNVHEGPTRNFAVAGLNPTGPIYIANVNTLAGRAVDEEWYFTDSIEAVMVDGRFALNVLVRAGANVVKGAGLTTDAVGRFTPAGTGDRVILIADEAYNNTTGIPQLVRARAA
jgi:hypothetical protein